MKKYFIYIIVFLLLGQMFALAVLSAKNDSAIRDELPHIVAGYSYLTKQDYRLNPEHPPLLKELSALPLLLIKPNFPDNHACWTNEANGQWCLGDMFLYQIGNDADKIIFWSRMPIIILMILLGIYLFKWTSELWGARTGLFALALYSFSPNIIAHGRFVTTDMGVTALMFIAFYYFWKMLEKPSKLNFSLTVLTFSFALLSKFSAVLLIPVFILIALLKQRFRCLALVFILAFIFIGFYYQLHLVNMPLGTQHQLISTSIDNGLLKNYLHKMTDIAVFRPYAQYLLGFSMVGSHSIGGHTTYFLGELGNHWWHYYFVAYLIKEPLAIQILLLIAFVFALAHFKKPKPIFIGIIAFVFLFLLMGATSKLQLGIRYILPIFPFIYMFIARYGLKFRPAALLIIWLAVSSTSILPSYLAYYNELVGPKNGYKYLIDSNTDWGQDLKRLAQFVEQNNIEKIRVDYFGGGNPEYYLGDKFIAWGAEKKPEPGWLAIGVSPLKWNQEKYSWLNNYQPVAQIGYSTFIYNIPGL
ncbi:MAG: hypothetical protein COX44_00615 [Candidatus Portnoybacteria bacterium CG23_combo_of_CG06-09_8_20_14_all_37_13]|uniref:Glycosyltransferase RgtA/B/C/D-like domain-containing protein n=1 Tax=Candidatus Portnoybacteria bacterium CG23_combo_of_CG06-09_8_20_14_all_37_13 TaxID=1974819 RepID=A0A2G9YDN8_9BACT|nr:MAG: hypothetical protein COX44_00615 [Candidatus Portnoybacteria bacterium CG23_combo_of_CG06-09_8_20_14_all_37_13]